MKRVVVPALVALALQMAAGGVFAWVSDAAYGSPRRIDEALEMPLTWMGLVIAGPLALSFATTAAFRSLRYARLALALPVVFLLCLPLMLISAFVTFTLAAVRGWC